MNTCPKCQATTVGWAVSARCDQQHWQAVLDAAPQAVLYYTDGNPTYLALLSYSGLHFALPNKSQTYRVEGDNAELRHYLACLAGKSRCLLALTQAVKLFVHAWNRRQLYKQAYPAYPAHLMQFL